MSVQHLMCVTEVTINNVYATLFICYPLLEVVLFYFVFVFVKSYVYCLKMVRLNRNMSQ
jgi:hypothetical protein